MAEKLLFIHLKKGKVSSCGGAHRNLVDDWELVTCKRCMRTVWYTKCKFGTHNPVYIAHGDLKRFLLFLKKARVVYDKTTINDGRVLITTRKERKGTIYVNTDRIWEFDIDGELLSWPIG